MAPGAGPIELLAAVGLADRGHHYPAPALRRRAAAGGARARLRCRGPPSCSPTSRPATSTARPAERILELLPDLRRREGTTLVLVTHDPAVAALADRRIHLRDGRRGARSPTAVVDAPAEPRDPRFFCAHAAPRVARLPAGGSSSSSPAWRSAWRRWSRSPASRRAWTTASAARPASCWRPTSRVECRRPLPPDLDEELRSIPGRRARRPHGDGHRGRSAWRRRRRWAQPARRAQGGRRRLSLLRRAWARAGAPAGRAADCGHRGGRPGALSRLALRRRRHRYDSAAPLPHRRRRRSPSPTASAAHSRSARGCSSRGAGLGAHGARRAPAAGCSTARCSSCRPTLRRRRTQAIAERLEETLGAAGLHTGSRPTPKPSRRCGEVCGAPSASSGWSRCSRSSLGGVGVAQTVRAWLAGRLDAIAILKCLGLRPREVLALYLGQTALLGARRQPRRHARSAWPCSGSCRGFLGDLVPAGAGSHARAGPRSRRGLALGIGVALLFSLPPLLAARRVPPVRVLRRDAEPLPDTAWAAVAVAVLLLGGVWLIASLQARSAVLGGQFAVGGSLATLALAGAACAAGALVAQALPRALAAALAAPRPRRPGPPGRRDHRRDRRPGARRAGGPRHVAGRAPAGERSSIASCRADAPTAFLVDIQPDQWRGVRAPSRGRSARPASIRCRW